MDEPKITVLAWVTMEVKPPKTTCLYSDGIEFWTGWYSPTDQCIYVKGVDGNSILPLDRVTHWAKLNNLMPIFTPS